MNKTEIYAQALADVRATLDDVTDPLTLLSTVTAVVHQALPYASWTGFYLVRAPRLLRVGPYQGPVACLEVPFDRGVCGAAARERRSQVVPDVHAFPGHVACDAAARSEVVVPVDDARGNLYGVLDLDSHQEASFDEEDRRGLEAIVEWLSPRLTVTDIGCVDPTRHTPGPSAG